jgi:hypothetical protein
VDLREKISGKNSWSNGNYQPMAKARFAGYTICRLK